MAIEYMGSIEHAPTCSCAQPLPPKSLFILTGIRLPWDRRPAWLWSRPWTASELPNTPAGMRVYHRLAAAGWLRRTPL